MSTPASIRVFEENGLCLVHIYAQHGGDPEACGKDIAAFLTRVTGGQKPNGGINRSGFIKHTLCNGADDLAAQLVSALKMDSPWGGIYLIPASERKQRWDWEYRYDIEVDDERCVWVRVKEGRKSIFAGDVASFVAFCNKAKA